MKKWLDSKTKISGRKTVGQWRKLRPILENDKSEELWRLAFDDFFRTRIQTRYLSPIETLDRSKKWEGEGTAIMILICSLIEFLQATYEGKICNDQESNFDPDIHYKSKDSSRLFKNFLKTHPPFKDEFGKKNSPLPKKFYDGVRNGLFHEARLKGQWRIHAYEGQEKLVKIEKDGRWIIHRANFKTAVFNFIDYYENLILTDDDLKEAFLRKIDSLCQE